MTNAVGSRRNAGQTSADDSDSLTREIRLLICSWRRRNGGKDPLENGLEKHVEPSESLDEWMSNHGRDGGLCSGRHGD